jgi:hypothetical protein
MSVRLSAWKNSAPTGWIFMEFDIGVILENVSGKFKFDYIAQEQMVLYNEDQCKKCMWFCATTLPSLVVTLRTNTSFNILCVCMGYAWISVLRDGQGTYNVTLWLVRLTKDNGRQQYVPFSFFFSGAVVALNNVQVFIDMEMQSWVTFVL